FRSDQPLWKLIAAMARSSATEDPRFLHDRITPDEVPQIDIEISVLSPMEKIDDPLAIELGVHGIYITGRGRSGTYLPQVATDHHMTKEQFLSSCCSGKAGLPADAWRTGEADVYIYTAEVFGKD
ncbi:AmmeMemoRadiSam system protein A, partial [bacterium]|nr:AmmeMemoRadiSam system protein A [bacterium]